MEEHIVAIEGLIEGNEKMTTRSPFLEVALGALYTALENAREHEAAMGRAAVAAAAVG